MHCLVGQTVIRFESNNSELVAMGRACHTGWETEQPADIIMQLSLDERVVGGPFTPRAVREGTHHHLAYYGWEASFDEASGICRGRLGSPASRELTLKRVESLTRVTLGRHLLGRGGLGFHGAGILKNGAAYLFVGPSGTGKTTLARQCPPDDVLSDDHCIAILLQDEWRLFGTPYSGREKTPSVAKDAPLAGIFLLEKSNHTTVTALAPSDAFRTLLPNIIHVGHERTDTELVLDAVSSLINRIPIGTLFLEKNMPFWKSIEEFHS